MANFEGVRIVCPICKKVLEQVRDDHEWRPFCGPRCKQIDLGNWLSEKYRIPQPLQPEDNPDDE